MSRQTLHLLHDDSFSKVLNDVHRAGVGFDRIFDGFRTTLGAYDSYPPYNVEQHSTDQFRITLALAGFSKEEISISKENDFITISGVKEDNDDDPVVTYLHKGIATRSFERKLQIAPDIEVRSAEMENGLLHIDLLRIVPEEKKATQIKIK
jgi:molecular chaperone IbpA